MFEWLKEKKAARKGMPSPRLEEEFKKRFLSQFRDQKFAELHAELDNIAQAAWDAYAHGRKSPRTHNRAGVRRS